MIIIINNKKYDVTEFLNEHPGGNNVFVDGKDMTEEFNAVGHSKHAIQMLKKYEIKNKDEINKDKINKDEINKDEINKDEIKDITICEFIKYKLFTRKDYLNTHKILGTITLINILYFLFDVWYSGCKGTCTIRKFNYTFFILLIIQLLLSLSSLQFHIPKNTNYTTISISEEYRMHSILFVIRHFLMIFVLRFIENKYI